MSLLSSPPQRKKEEKPKPKKTLQKKRKNSTTSSTAKTFPKQSPEKNPLGEKKPTSKKLLDETRMEALRKRRRLRRGVERMRRREERERENAREQKGTKFGQFWPNSANLNLKFGRIAADVAKFSGRHLGERAREEIRERRGRF
jgi:hypothetical protein